MGTANRDDETSPTKGRESDDLPACLKEIEARYRTAADAQPLRAVDLTRSLSRVGTNSASSTLHRRQ